MEHVWDELKKIEAQAEQIQIEAQNKAKNIKSLAQQEAEKLVANSKAYAEEEAQSLYEDAVQDANRLRNQQLKTNQAAVAKMKATAEKRMDNAVSVVVKAVLEETTP